MKIEQDVEVKTGVTLEVPASKTVYIEHGVTMTVNGAVNIVNAEDGAFTIASAAEEDDEGTEVDETLDGTVIVNGKFQYNGNFTATYSEQIVGAYFTYEGKKTIMPFQSVPAIADDIESTEVTLYGAMDIGAIDFSAYAGPGLTVIAANNLDIDTITLGSVRFTAGTGSSVTGTIILANGTIVLTDVTGITAYDSTDKDGNVTSEVEGTSVKADDGDAKTDDDKGSVSITGAITSSANYEVTVSVPSGATLTVSGGSFNEVSVDGTLEAVESFTATKAIISGTMNIAEKKTADIGTLYAGVTVDARDDADYITSNTAAVITGSIDTTDITAYVGPDATVPEDFIKSFENKSTAYYVAGDLYVTAYTTGTEAIDSIKVDLDYADFKGWAATENGTTAVSSNIGKESKVYAILDYDICTIEISQIPGVTIYIDGQPYDGGKVSVGEHNISVYVKPGYTGEPQITVNGQAVENGGTFTASADAPTQISVSGITTGNYSGGDDGGMGLTEILLIILVVLIVIMAIMVALRLMRS